MTINTEDSLAILSVVVLFLGLLVSWVFLWVLVVLIVIQIGHYHWHE